MQKRSNALLRLREMGQRLQSEFPILSIINNEEEHQKALDIMEILLQDYDNNLLLIDALSCAITRYEQSEQFTQ
jgi:antitoxin component HigA of HigAB toxin-antitoxin module